MEYIDIDCIVLYVSNISYDKGKTTGLLIPRKRASAKWTSHCHGICRSNIRARSRPLSRLFCGESNNVKKEPWPIRSAPGLTV
jgi:hypothetical protein